jgi:hypothetical protein
MIPGCLQVVYLCGATLVYFSGALDSPSRMIWD